MGMELLMARARLNHLAAAAIQPIGSKATAQTLTFTTGQLSQTVQAALPSGCAAGDVVTLTCIATGFAGFAWGVPSGAVTALSARSLGGYPIVVYTYTLASADVSAGTVGIPCTITTSGSWSIPVVGVVDAHRGVSEQNLDVVGTYASGTLTNGAVATCIAPGITTTRNGDLLRYCLFTNIGSVSTAVTPPGGYTAGDAPFSVNNGSAYTGYAQQAVAGPTGDVAASVTPAGSGNWGIILLSLRAAAPAITLSASFPSSPHVGDTVNFDVTATLVDGATGTPTITVDQLPAGLSLGSTSMVDATHYKATVPGTLTTAQTITSTFGATGGSVAATPLAHEFDVTEAGATVDLVDCGHSANSGTTVNMSVPVSVAAGDTILAVLSARQGATNTGPAGFTLLDDYIAVASTSLPEILVYKKTADGTETSVAATSSRASNGAGLQVWKIPGGANIQTFRGGRTFGTVTAWSVGPFTPANDNSAVIAFWACGLPITEGTYGVDAAWSGFTVVDTNTGANLGTASIGWATQQQTTAAAATANFTASSGVQNPCNYMIAVSK